MQALCAVAIRKINISITTASDGGFLSKSRFVTVIFATYYIKHIVTSTTKICAKRGVERFKVKEELNKAARQRRKITKCK